MDQKQPLRILYVLNASGGGATQGILDLLRALPRTDYQAFIVVPDRPSKYQQEIFLSLAESCFQVPMSWWNLKVDLPWYWRLLVWARDWLKTLGHLLPLWQLCHIIREQKIDLVYTNSIMILDGALAAFLCGIPHIWHIKEWIGRHARVKFWLPDAVLAWVIVKLSARVLVMTQFIGEIFERYNLAGRISLIYDGVDVDLFEKENKGRALRDDLGVKENHFLIGMAASLSSTWKQHWIFIEMAARLAKRFPNARFVAFGPEPKYYRNPAYNRPWHYYSGLKEQVTQLGLDEKFIWAGFHANIAQMMAALDILVHPCDQEPFGRVAIEAMAAGRPVVGPNQGGIAESVVDEQTGLLVQSGDVEAFARAVAQLIENPEVVKRLSQNGRLHIASHFPLKQHVHQIEEIYVQILQENGCLPSDHSVKVNLPVS